MKTKTLLGFMAASIAAVAIACGGGGGGGGGSRDTSASPTAPSAPAATQPATGAATQPAGQATQPAGQQQAASDLARLGQALSQVRSFRAQIIIEEGGSREEMRMEVVMPDRFRMDLGGIQMISIGNDSWMNFGGGWVRQPGAGSSAPFSPAEIQAAFRDLATSSTVTRGSTTTVNGVRCQVLNVREADGTETEVCVADNGLPVRFVTTERSTKTTVLFSDFNANINIQPPN